MPAQVKRQVSYIPTNDSIINPQDTTNLENTIARILPNKNQDNFIISPTYERFFNSIRVQLNDIVSRGFPTLTVNPDFNWARDGITPVTQADGDDVAFNEQWYVNGAAGNTYTITPTAYPDTSTNTPTGSKYFINVAISSLTNPLTLYNVNYNSDFNAAQQLQNQKVVFSSYMQNNTADPVAMQFSVQLEDLTTFSSKIVNLLPGFNFVSMPPIDIPDYSALSLPGNAFAQLQLKFLPSGGSVADVNIAYIKAEISSLATNLTVNHIEQKLLIDGLNS